MHLSVIICTHNPKRELICRVISALKEQSLSVGQWELILVDNASTNNVVETIDLLWHPNGRIIREAKLGLTNARLRGIRESQSKVLVFVDDDNLLSRNYLTEVLAIVDQFPKIGAFGGRCTPEFMDGEPPDWTRRYWGCLGIIQFDGDFWSNQNDKRCMPIGAGLVVIREVAQAYLRACETDRRRIQLDRQGDNMISGGDIDMALCAIDLGLGIGRFQRLELLHLMPGSRLQENNLVRMYGAIVCSGKVLNYVRSGQSTKFRRSVLQRMRRLAMEMLGGRRDIHYRFRLAMEKGLRDADHIIERMQAGEDMVGRL